LTKSSIHEAYFSLIVNRTVHHHYENYFSLVL